MRHDAETINRSADVALAALDELIATASHGVTLDLKHRAMFSRVLRTALRFMPDTLEGRMTQVEIALCLRILDGKPGAE